MRTPKLWVDLVRWRWAPAVALCSGALLYVVLVILLIPEEIGRVAPGSLDAGRFAGATPANTSLYSARIGASAANGSGEEEPVVAPTPEAPMPPPAQVSTPQGPEDLTPRRGFSPPLPRPEPPPPPPLPEPPPAIVIPPPLPPPPIAPAAIEQPAAVPPPPEPSPTQPAPEPGNQALPGGEVPVPPMGAPAGAAPAPGEVAPAPAPTAPPTQ